MEIIDPDKTLFSHLLFRNSCIQTDNGLYIKDLRAINRDLKSTVIVDNTVMSFAFQLDNGVPIMPFYDEKEDTTMLKITEYLMSLKEVEDVRINNRKAFSLQHTFKLNVPSFLKYYYEDESSIDNEHSVESIDSSLEMKKSGSDNIGEYETGKKMGKRTRTIIEKELGKFQETFPKYFESQGKESQ